MKKTCVLHAYSTRVACMPYTYVPGMCHLCYTPENVDNIRACNTCPTHIGELANICDTGEGAVGLEAGEGG